MKCTKCGNELKDTAKFCPFCGSRVEEPVTAAPAEKSDDTAADKRASDIQKAADEIIRREDMKKAEENSVVITPIPPKEPAPYDMIPDTTENTPIKTKHTARNIIIAVCVIAVLAGGAGIFAYPRYIKPAADYSVAEKLMAQGDYDGAAEAFAALSDYKDSANRENEARYQMGKAAMESGSYDTAEAIFLSISGYSDSAQLANECRIKTADALAASGDYENAASAYLALGDSAKYESCILSYAEQLAAEGNYTAASAKITEAQLTSPEAEEALVKYAVSFAAKFADNGEYGEAIALLEPYKDNSYDNTPVSVTLNEYTYQNVLAKRDGGTLTEQDVMSLAALGAYKDSKMQLPELFRTVGKQYAAQKDYLAAYAMYTNAGDYTSSPAKANSDLYSAARTFSESGDHASAATIYAYLGSFADCTAKFSQEMGDPSNSGRQGWSGLITPYSGEYAVSRIKSGETLTVKGTVKHSASAANADFSVKLTLPDGSEQAVSCGKLSSGGSISAQFDIPENISGTAEISLVLDSSGMTLLKLSREIVQ